VQHIQLYQKKARQGPRITPYHFPPYSFTHIQLWFMTLLCRPPEPLSLFHVQAKAVRNPLFSTGHSFKEDLEQATAISMAEASRGKETGKQSKLKAIKVTRQTDAARHRSGMDSCELRDQAVSPTYKIGTQGTLGVLSHPVTITTPTHSCPEHLEDDNSKIEVLVKLPRRKSMRWTFRRSHRVGLIIMMLHGQGFDMRKHQLYIEKSKHALVDYRRLQDEGIQQGHVLVVKRAAGTPFS
jgi:hypothetical protein